MNTTILPKKWAVEITSLEDAERLQKLFPDAKSFNQPLTDVAKDMIDWVSRIDDRYGCGCMTPYYIDNTSNGDKWSYGTKDYFNVLGYTIYTITELDALKSQE